MNVAKRAAPLFKRTLLLAAVLLASLLYLWQAADAWTGHLHAGQANIGINIRSMLAGRDPDARELAGAGIAAGAKGIVYYFNRDTKGLLQVQDMPVLPARQIYEMWCVDAAGNVDASSVFRVPTEAQETNIVEVSAPHMLSSYTRFFITIEPLGGSQSPSAQTVMASVAPGLAP